MAKLSEVGTAAIAVSVAESALATAIARCNDGKIGDGQVHALSDTLKTARATLATQVAAYAANPEAES